MFWDRVAGVYDIFVNIMSWTFPAVLEAQLLLCVLHMRK